MTPRRARWLLWGAALLFVPLPYLLPPVDGAVPVVRFLLLGAVTSTYSLSVDGGGVAWTMAAMLTANAVIYALALGAAAWGGVRVVPEAALASCVWVFVVVAAAIGLAFPVYRTPFDDLSIWTRWWGLFG